MAASPPQTLAPSARWTRLDWAALALLALLGALNLAQPLAWDQTMFALGARRMHAGGVLYRDYWDPKQPGLFFFYELAGVLFGWGAGGVHLLELIALVGFGALLVFSLRTRFTHRALASWAPLLAIGWFYAVTTDWHLTQIEALVALPLYVSAWSAARAAETRARRTARLVLAGVAGGAALALKVLFAPIVLAMWIVPLARIAAGTGGTRGRGAAAAARAALALAAGVALAVAPLALYFAAHHATRLFLWTTFVYPGQALSQLRSLRIHYLLAGLGWFAVTWAPLLALLPFALRDAAPTGPAAARTAGGRSDALTLALALWVGVGFFTLMVQSLSYWEYQFVLLAAPLGLLAARAVDTLWPKLGRPARTALVLALVAIPAVHVAQKTATLAAHGFALDAASRDSYQVAVSHDRALPRIRADVAWLAGSDARPGPIWVMGNPMIYAESGRAQAIPRNGASFIEYATPEEWARITADLERARPTYVFVWSAYLPMLSASTDKCAGFLNWLGTDYRAVRRTREGFWFERRQVPAAR
jgi:hypothetical protein